MKRDDFRKEHDMLGEMEIDADALYGIHTARARDNFDVSQRTVHADLIKAYAMVKCACARSNHELGFLDDVKFEAIEKACFDIAEGLVDDAFSVDALQGGAGTSTNMYVNEVIANRALELAGAERGDYSVIHPLEDVNLHQSTNDTYPTALRVAAIGLLRELEKNVVGLAEGFQAKEKAFSHIVKIGRTQLQDAVLTTLGREMGAYAEAVSRDRWRIYKCEERLRVVNLGGTAIGTGLGAPRKFIFGAVEHLRALTGIGLARAENLVEATQNCDVFVEVSGILKALASNLLKICTDLRLLSSGPDGGIGEIVLPAVQAGSSIMPGKVNPVIAESVSQGAIMVCGNDGALTQACSMGNMELNQFMPLIADLLLSNIKILCRGCAVLNARCVSGIEADEQRCRRNVESSTAIVTAIVDEVGYEAGQRLCSLAKARGITIREAAISEGLLSDERFDELISPERVMMLGSKSRRAE